MKRHPLVVVLLLALLAVPASLLVSRSTAQPPAQQPQWSWPDSSKNLKVLPKNTDKQKLRAVMTGFTRALGVRCSHCHVGKEGEPLSTYDFASDKNPKKDVARGMLKMLGSVNDQLKEIQPDVSDRVNMWCNTCHHGLPRPRTLVEELNLTYDKSGADSTVARYRTLRATYDNAGAFDFRERSLFEVARHAQEKKDMPGAITLLTLNVERFPQSAFAHAGLGDAYIAAGDTMKAIGEYERAAQIDPKDQNLAKELEKLRRR